MIERTDLIKYRLMDTIRNKLKDVGFGVDEIDRSFELLVDNIITHGVGGFGGNLAIRQAVKIRQIVPENIANVGVINYQTDKRDILTSRKLIPPNFEDMVKYVFIGLTDEEYRELKEINEKIRAAERGEITLTNEEIDRMFRRKQEIYSKLIGGGGIYENGRRLFEISRGVIDEVASATVGALNVIVAGFGGATGSAGSPVVAERLAMADREERGTIVLFGTKPHKVEGRDAFENYIKAVQNARPYTDLVAEVSGDEFPNNINYIQYKELVTQKIIELLEVFTLTQMEVEGVQKPIDPADLKAVLRRRGVSYGTAISLSNISPDGNRVKPLKELLMEDLVNFVEKKNMSPDAMIVYFRIPFEIDKGEVESTLGSINDKLGLYLIRYGIIQSEREEMVKGQNTGLFKPLKPKEVRVSALVIQYDKSDEIESNIMKESNKYGIDF